MANNQTEGAVGRFSGVRNAFAHRAFKVSITDSVVASHLAVLNHDLEEAFGGNPDSAQLRIHDSLLCKLVLLAFETSEPC
jgi:hypothetical protein